jgi:hypothetical protein
MIFANRTHEHKAQDLKDILVRSREESAHSQEDLADMCGTSQPTIQRWFSYTLDHFPPIWALALLPEEVVVPLCKHFLSRFKKTISTLPSDLHTDGSLDDDLLNIDVIQAEIIKRKDKDPRKALEWIDKLRVEVDTLEAELKLKIEGNR